MAIQWHPLLAQFLQHDLRDRVEIRDSVPLGEMPVEMDLLFEPTVAISSLAYPYNHLGQRTIGEFKGAGDWADWRSVAQIESYACLYQMQQKIEDRSQVILWVIASQFARSFARYIEDLRPIGDGVARGLLTGFPIYRIDLATLPITPATFPLLMVYKGDLAREAEIVRFFIAHYDELGNFGSFIEMLHPQALTEVLKTMNIESLRGFDLDLPAILRLFETRKIIENVGTQAFIENVGTQTILENIGSEKVVEALLSTLNDEEKERLIERIRQSQGNRRNSSQSND